MKNKHIRTAAAVLLAAAAFFLLCLITEGSSDYEPVSDLSFYFSNEEQVVSTLRESLKKHDSKITLHFTLTGEVMEDLNPMASELWSRALEDTGDPEEGDYLRYQTGGYTLSYGHIREGKGYRYVLCLEPKYYTDVKEYEQTEEAVSSLLKELALPKNASDREKAEAVHNWLCEHVRYDEVHSKHYDYHLNATAYAALVNREASCQGFAVAVYRLMEELGVDCRVVTGMALNNGSQEYHAWNRVCVDGEWLNLDVTWDAAGDTDCYFLKTDEEFSALGYEPEENSMS